MELLQGIEPSPIYYSKDDYIETLTGNRVSRKSVLCGSQNIRLYGKAIIKPNTIIRGDLANVNIGRFFIGWRKYCYPTLVQEIQRRYCLLSSKHWRSCHD